jgi:hypothetical protein
LSTVLGKSNGKKCIGHIPEPYSDVIAISYIPYWINAAGRRHMTEGRPADGSSSSERSRRSANSLYTNIMRELRYKAKSW